MKVFTVNFVGNGFEKTEVKSDMGVEIQHRGNTFSVDQDRHGNLIFRLISSTQLILKPQVANSVMIEVEK